MESLDIGCGSRAIGKITLDISREFRPTVIGDAHCLPFIDESFDVTLSSHVIEHLDKPLQALNEITRVTKKKIILRFPTEESERWWLFFFDFPTGISLRRNHGHKWIIKPEIVISRLKTSGWKMERIEKGMTPLLMFFEGGRKGKALKWLTKYKLYTPCTYQHVLVSKNPKTH